MKNFLAVGDLYRGMTGALLTVAASAALFFATTTGASAQDGKGQCAVPNALKASDASKEAREEYVKVLKADPTAQCALSSLAALNAEEFKSAAPDCKRGQAYLDAHRDEEAVKAFGAGLEKNPEAACAKKGLEDADSSWFTRTAENLVEAIPSILVFAGFILVAFFVFLLVGYWPPANRFLRWFPLVGTRLIGRVLGPRVTFEAIDDEAVAGKPGGAIAARIKERLARMRERALQEDALEHDLDLSTPSDEFADIVSGTGGLQNSLDNASDISDQAKVVAALLSLFYALLPIPRFSISGSLEPPGDDGPSATMLLERNSKLEGAAKLQGSKAGNGQPTAPDFMQLADGASVWVQYEIARSLAYEPPSLNAAESGALVEEGLERYRQGKLKKARARYVKALELDRRNWAAYICLAVAEARLSGDFNRSIRKIEEGRDLMRGE